MYVLGGGSTLLILGTLGEKEVEKDGYERREPDTREGEGAEGEDSPAYARGEGDGDNDDVA